LKMLRLIRAQRQLCGTAPIAVTCMMALMLQKFVLCAFIQKLTLAC